MGSASRAALVLALTAGVAGAQAGEAPVAGAEAPASPAEPSATGAPAAAQSQVAHDAQLVVAAAAIADAVERIEVGGYIKGSYRYSDDFVYTFDPVSFTDQGSLNGFGFESISLAVDGEVEGVDFRVTYNPDKQKLRSAYARFEVVEGLDAKLGRFKAPLLRGRRVRTTRLLFLQRTILARITGPRDLGAQVIYDPHEDVRLYASLQNGEDGDRDGVFVSSRLEFGLVGGGVGKYEGAYGADELELTLGLGLADDGTIDDGRLLALDVAATWDRFSLAAEVVDQGDDFAPIDVGLLDPAAIIARAGNRPWGATASGMLVRDELELAVRWEDFDNDQDTRRLGVSLNWYQRGHELKWVAQWQKVHSNLPLLESDVFALGLVFAF